MGTISGKSVKRGLFTLFRVFLTIVAICSSPVLFLLYGLILSYRWIVSKTARYLDPKLRKMVSAMSNWFAAHDVYGNSYTINVALHVVGKIDKFHIIRALGNLLENYGQQYPELTQNIVTKFGYKFWRCVDNFRVDNHVAYMNQEDPDTVVTLEEIQGTIAKFGKTPLDPAKSPWQVYIVKNFASVDNPLVKSAIVLRLHHAMFDGFSVLSVFGKMADNGPFVLGGQQKLEELIASQKSTGLKSKLQAVLKPPVMLFRGTYELVGQMMAYDDNELTRQCRANFKNVMRFYECPPIKLDELKVIKNYYGVTMTSLLTTLVIRGVKKFIEDRKIRTKKIHMTFPLPVLNHPDKLRNYFSGGIISFDLSHNDPVKLLHEVEKKYFQFRYSYSLGLPEVSMLLLRIVGSLPIFLMPRIDNVALGTTTMHSSFPGPVDVGYFCGFPVVDATVGGSISKPYPTGTLCYSYNGVYKFGVMADASIFLTQQDAEAMGDNIFQQFLQFARMCNENLV